MAQFMECFIGDRGVAGSSLTVGGVAVLPPC